MRYVPRHAAPRAGHRMPSGVLVAAVLATACAGPMTPLHVDVHAVGSNITLGAHNEAVAQVHLPPSVLPLAPGAPTLPPPALRRQHRRPSTPPPLVNVPSDRPTSPPGPCPAAPPLETPAIEAGFDVTSAPAPARYHYRTAGTWRVGTTTATYPKDTIEQIGNVTWGPNRQYFEYDVTATVGKVETVAHYRVVPDAGSAVHYQQVPPIQPGQQIPQPPHDPPTQAPSPAPTVTVSAPPYPNLPYIAVGAPAQPGIYLVSVASGTDTAVYNGDSGMLLATLPLGENMGFQSSATAGSRTIEYTSVVGKHARINACGTYLDSWGVHVQGTVTQADTAEGPSVAVNDTYWIAPQFGGLILATRERTTSGSNNTVQVAKRVSTTIDSVPKAPK